MIGFIFGAVSGALAYHAVNHRLAFGNWTFWK